MWAAILESNGASIVHRISKARVVINERLNSCAQITLNEHEAIDAAVQKLATLKVQQVELIPSTMPTGDTEPVN